MSDGLDRAATADQEALMPVYADSDPSGNAAPLGVHPQSLGAGAGGERLDDDAVNRDVRRFQESLTDWTFGPLAQRMHAWSDELWDRFLPQSFDGAPVVRPPVLLTLSPESARRFGHYRPGRNGVGFKWEVNVNPRHLPGLSEIEVAAILLHELHHVFEDVAGKQLRSRNGYHSGWFRTRAGVCGIPCTPYGGALPLPPESPFMEWAVARGLAGERGGFAGSSGQPAAARRPPKRVKWTCLCDPPLRVSVLVARGSDLQAHCDQCDGAFRRAQ